MSALDPKTLIRGLIAWMRMENVWPTRTRLVKFLYLADLQNARYRNGTTLTKWRWHVGSFGPVANECLDTLDDGERTGWIQARRLESDEDPESGHAAVIYSIPREDHESAASAMPPILGKVRSWIKTYGDDTSRLLGFVYASTEPMDHVRPGDVLDFTRAHPVEQAKPFPSKPAKKTARDRIKKLLESIRADYEAEQSQQSAMFEGPYDDVYYNETPAEEEPPRGELTISFKA
ncbi:hypothetical protein WME91_25850 [Sorangium sp. So ce269]